MKLASMSVDQWILVRLQNARHDTETNCLTSDYPKNSVQMTFIFFFSRPCQVQHNHHCHEVGCKTKQLPQIFKQAHWDPSVMVHVFIKWSILKLRSLSNGPHSHWQWSVAFRHPGRSWGGQRGWGLPPWPGSPDHASSETAVPPASAQSAHCPGDT